MSFKYLENMDKPTTRSRSKKQESRLAKVLNGHTTINSGATFGQNDVITDFCEIEAKTTTHESYTLTLADWRKLRAKCAVNKMPIFVVDFEKCKDSLVVLTYEDFELILQQAQKSE